ncbi:uncharacterized protein LOC108259636 isoform X2 [Ictalurus punctatus]|uniref:Uncharacterized protein LOC108259636 isoform X2 n=1 Tax=Ictalurus punctatus TaxID=7998 RepID=A0A2D0QAP0_ICTPU|nr:uncharacterized protein LOC108259636 isoform X2 [Ictalurus punctatus]
MLSGSNALAFYVMVLGNVLGAQTKFIERLQKRLHLREVYSVEECDVVIAFVPVVSRAGTDIQSALQKLETSQPVVLVVFHHTFDVNYVAPDSKLSVKKDGVFAVDILFHEDDGLLNGLHNDKMLKSTTDYLISKGASPDIQTDPAKTSRRAQLRLIVVPVLVGCVVAGVVSAITWIFIVCF